MSFDDQLDSRFEASQEKNEEFNSWLDDNKIWLFQGWVEQDGADEAWIEWVEVMHTSGRMIKKIDDLTSEEYTLFIEFVENNVDYKKSFDEYVQSQYELEF